MHRPFVSLFAFSLLAVLSSSTLAEEPGESKPFATRSGAERAKLVKDLGGSMESEAAVDQGLKWLADHQAPDGHWSLHEFNKHARKKGAKGVEFVTDKCVPGTTKNDDVAGTALALLPFLARGHTHKAANLKPDYAKTVKDGLDFLIKKQARDGNFGGSVGYSHAIATLAVCEAYGMTADPLLKAPAQAAIRYIESAQDPTGGGWRYQPRQPGDLSVTGWNVMALKTAQLAGLVVKKEVLTSAEKFVKSSEKAQNPGQYCYTPGTTGTPAMTAVGLLCQQYFGTPPRNAGLVAGVEWLNTTHPPTTPNIYYTYYATQVMHHMGGDAWNKWNLGPDGSGKGGIRDTLLERVDKGDKVPEQAGSWMLPGENGGGRIMSTSLALLTLEVYYRHPRLYKRDVEIKDPKDKPE